MISNNAWLKHLFEPETVAVIGASNTRLKWGNLIPTNILRGGYQGRLCPVNPKEDTILGKEVFRSVKDIPGEVDLAIITVPASVVIPAVRECVEKGVKTCIVISGGFGEAEGGAALQDELVKAIEGSSMRLVGPNTMGIYSSNNSLHALMPPVRPLAGKIGFAAQSGNLGTQMLTTGKALGVGFSRFVCIGNEADLNCTDYMEFLLGDPETDVIMLYLEGLQDPRRFIEVAANGTRDKPIIVMKAGKTEAGAQAAKSHSAALAADDSIFEGVLRQTGMIEAESTEDMIDIAKALAVSPLPRGRRIGVLTWGGGWGVVTADALARCGLVMAVFTDDLIEQLDALLPPYWSRGNPVDLVGTLDLSIHFACLEAIARCETVDAVIGLGTLGASNLFDGFMLEEAAQGGHDRTKSTDETTASLLRHLANADETYGTSMMELMKETGKPIVAVSFPNAESMMPAVARSGKMAIYPTPERGAKVLAALCEYSEFLERIRGS